MSPKDPFRFYGLGRRLPGMRFATTNQTKKPYIGVTQGGSTRPGHPAKVAATRGEKRAQLKQQEITDERRTPVGPFQLE